MIRRTSVALCILAAALLSVELRASDTRVTLLHFSDYHSHAVPFFLDGRAGQAGIARAIRFLRTERAKPNTFVLSGGDMMNIGSPAWSDKYRCADWSLFDGIVDAMAFGNHDADYGAVEFAKCQASGSFPILGANVTNATGAPLFLHEGKPWKVLVSGNVRIGVIALAGSDFSGLIRPERLPATGALFSDRIATARELVRRLRHEEKVDAVVLIGHAHLDDDAALARAVPGIDLVFGSHSHVLKELEGVEGSRTVLISAGAYLTHIARVDLVFHNGGLTKISGQLVAMTPDLPEDRKVRKTVRRMQAMLEHDREYRDLFRRIGRAESEISMGDPTTGESAFASFVLDVVRASAEADVAVSTGSSFRQSIAPGPVRMEDLRASLPYPNKILRYQVRGAELRALLESGASQYGSDGFLQISGIRVVIDRGRLISVEIQRDGSFAALDDEASYTLATTDYLALRSSTYRNFFAAREPDETDLEVRDEVRKAFEVGQKVSGRADGRIAVSVPGGVR